MRTSTTLRTPSSTRTVARASVSSASTRALSTSTTLNRRGCLGSGAAAGRGRGFGGTKTGSRLGAGFFRTLSSGTISAPVPLVPESSTHALRLANGSGRVAQSLETPSLLEVLEGIALELVDPLPAQAELLRDGVARLLLAVREPEPQ